MAFVTAILLRGGSPFIAHRRLLCSTDARTAASSTARFLHARANAIRPPSTTPHTEEPAPAASRTSSTTRSELTATRFADLALVAPLQRALAGVFCYETATTVQERSVPAALLGADLLVKAKTGTGKTLAFSLPALNHVLSTSPPAGQKVQILVLSPTRELAMQIAAEAAALATYASKEFKIQTVVGGTNVKSDVTRFRAGMPTMLIATPGRLEDHLQTPSSGLSHALRGLEVLVLDEADRLMDMGFRPSVERILGYLPPVGKRQTLLFSATMPADVRDMTRLALKPTHEVIDCVGADTATHTKVSQKVVVAPMYQTVAALKVVIDTLIEASPNDYKVMVFLPTARQCQIHAELWRAMQGNSSGVNPDSVLEIHSRKSQAYRTRTAAAFREGTRVIMFSSDVTARGMDFPDVTAVVQFGRPSDREQYVHRLGRTARGDGLVGRGVLVLGDFEARTVSKILSDLPLSVWKLEDKPLARAANDVGYGFAQVSDETKAQAYQATLGYYKQYAKTLSSRHGGNSGIDAAELVEIINEWALDVAGCEEIPKLNANVVGKMGLRGTPGLIVTRGRAGNEQRNGGGRGGQGAIGGRFGGGRRGDGGGRSDGGEQDLSGGRIGRSGAERGGGSFRRSVGTSAPSRGGAGGERRGRNSGGARGDLGAPRRGAGGRGQRSTADGGARW